MNLFFGIKSLNVDSKLTIPRFKNSHPTRPEYKVFQLKINNQRWEVNNLIDEELNKDFFKINGNLIDNGSIFCLATQEEILDFKNNNHSKLINFNNYTDTSPSFRTNLQVSIKDGGFSSYQSEYPFSMVTKKGSILSPLSSLFSKDADKNILFLKNIYELPVNEEFGVFFVNLKTKKILKKEVALTNFLNEFIVDEEFIKPDIFLFTDKYIGIPIFCSIQDNYVSLEHTHPPHEYIMSDGRFKVISELKKEFNEIIS
jgi:hypothetical protein